MTVAEVRDLQRQHALDHTHVVWIGPEGFSIAHTDEERNTSGFDLEDCRVHEWLCGFPYQPALTGVYVYDDVDDPHLQPI